VLSICSFLRCRSSRRETIESEEKRSKILTWFNLSAVAAGTKARIEEDEEEAEGETGAPLSAERSGPKNESLRAAFHGSKG
jgi:hypothetical protein